LLILLKTGHCGLVGGRSGIITREEFNREEFNKANP